MKKKLILWSIAISSILIANTFAANWNDLFGSLWLDTPTWNTGATTQKKTTNTTTSDNLFWGTNAWQGETWPAPTQKKTTQKQLKKLWYTISWSNLQFDVNYLPKESNFIVEFTGNRNNDIVLSWVQITNLSWKVLDLWGLNNKINLIIVGGWNIKKISLSELNKKWINITKTDKVYLQGKFNNIDKQVLSTLLNNKDTFEIVFNKWKKVNELLPSKEGILENNSTLEVNYIYSYSKKDIVSKQVVKWKIVNKVRQQVTWTTDVAISVLVVFMMILSFYYIKTWKVE